MAKRRRRGMRIEDAMAVVDDGLPDGAYFAMLDELTGSEPGGAIDLIAEHGEWIDEKTVIVPAPTRKPKR